MQMKEITYKEALREAMVEEMRRDEDIIFLGEDIGVYGGGFGHGVGMSQNAAKALAAAGYVYTDILGYFYQGTALQQVY